MSAFVTLAMFGACSSPTEPGEWQRVVGSIDLLSSAGPIAVIPDGITAGRPFVVTVTTVGSSSCTRADGAAVGAGTGIAVITPYDQVLRGEAIACTDDLHPFPRDVSVTIPTAGAAVIRIVGRNARGDQELTYEVAVTVLPGS